MGLWYIDEIVVVVGGFLDDVVVFGWYIDVVVVGWCNVVVG